MAKLNSIFDSGFSGIIDEGIRKSTMPDYLERLAEREINSEDPKEVEPIEGMDFESNLGLARASELSDDSSRVIESRKVESKDFKEEIETAVQNLLSDGNEPEEIEKALIRKFPRSQVNKYFEANSFSMLKRYAKIAAETLPIKNYNTSKEIEDAFRDHKAKLQNGQAIEVLSSFCQWISDKKNFQRKNDLENRVAFKRDIDKKELREREVSNNVKRNAHLKELSKAKTIFQEFKSHIQSGLSKNEAHLKIAKVYDLSSVEKFYQIYTDQLDKIIGFYKRQSFGTEFRKLDAKIATKEINEFESKIPEYREKQMMSTASRLMTEGKNLDEIKESLKRKFELRYAKQFIKENGRKLEKLYGQLGYVFIDSSAYSNCDEMKKAYTGINHIGNLLAYCVKANGKCKGCSDNKHGTCEKVGMLISNNPFVRSPRASRRVFEKASAFVPKSHIEKYAVQISDNGNAKLISEFVLGIKGALEQEKRKIGKTASKHETVVSSETFEKSQSYNVDLFKKAASSKIIDDVMGV